MCTVNIVFVRTLIVFLLCVYGNVVLVRTMICFLLCVYGKCCISSYFDCFLALCVRQMLYYVVRTEK